MLKNNFVVILLNIYLVYCAPTEERNYLPANGATDQITKESNLNGVSVPGT